MKNSQPRIMLAAPASGTGKTMLTTGLLQVLAARGMRPAAFKCGPDYVDPMFHREALGVPGRNLDLFLARPQVVRGMVRRGMADAGIAIFESAMGFYDGVGASDRASGWRVAAETGTPVVLALHPKGAFLSLAAVVTGMVRFREESFIRGVVLNRCGEAYAEKLTPMLERETGIRVYGYLPELPEAMVESRHLGLMTPGGIANLRERIDRLAGEMGKSVDVDGLIALAESASDFKDELPDISRIDGASAKIAVAMDEAFCFYYEENLELLRAFGAELVFFSPMRDERLPEGIGGLYLGGGYPELHAEALSANSRMRSDIRRAIEAGLPVVAESGGFLYLQSGIADTSGQEYPMAGVLEGVGRNTGRLKRFGYIRLRARHDNLLCDAGSEVPAHEFHRWDSANTGDSFVARKEADGSSWDCIVANSTMFAGFPHLYFWSEPAMARRFVEAALGCR